MSLQNEDTPLFKHISPSSAQIASHCEHQCSEEEDNSSRTISPMRRKSPLILFSFIIFLVGMIARLNESNIGTEESGTVKVLKSKKLKTNLQDVAHRNFENNLVKPSYEAELIYHPTKNEKKHPVLGDSIDAKSTAKPPPEGCQGTVIIIRHCEKGSIREHCDTMGFERAHYISTLFGAEAEARWPAPSYLFALAPGERHNKHVNNYREVETLQPLSDKIGVPIDSSFGMDNKKDFSDHIFSLLRSGKMCGKVALISWKHQDIPHLARSLGCGPADGCPKTWASSNDFDSTWQILYSYHKQLYPSFAIEEKKNSHKSWGQHPRWWISGHVQKEGFDPLQFMKNGDGYN